MNLRGGILIVACGLATLGVGLGQSFVSSARVDELRAVLGPAAPDGSGVAVVQSEASDDGNFYPQEGQGTFSGSFLGNNRDYRGVSFIGRSGEQGISNHAQSVARRLFERSLGIAPGIVDVSLYRAEDYQSWTGNPSAVSEGRIHNSSWIGTGSVASLNQTIIDNADSAALERGFLHCIGLNNRADTTVPPIYGHAYNCLAVGRRDGNHSRGGTLAAYTGPGRMKPDLVGAGNVTSFATPEVSAVAALLFQTVDEDLSLAAANDPNVMRAILLAGADKDFNPAWAREAAAEPYDPVFGAGLLDAFESYFILTGGEQTSNTPEDTSRMGWAALNSVEAHRFRFTVPPGKFGTQFCAALSWFRAQDGRDGQRTNLTLRLLKADQQGDFQLFEESASPVDNVEHLFRRHLLPGTYLLEVPAESYRTGFIFQRDEGFEYALAWRLQVGGGPELSVGPDGSWNAAELDPRASYEVQRSESLLEGSWTTIENLPANSRFSGSGSDPSAPGDQAFYRLRWVEPAPLP